MQDRDKILAKILTETSFVHFEQNGQVSTVITEEHDALKCLLEFEIVTRKIIASTKPLFTAQRDKRTKRLILRSPGLGGEALRLLSHACKESIERHFPAHEFTPYYELFWDQARKCELLGLPLAHLSADLPEHQIQEVADRLTDWVAAIRTKAHSRQFRAKVDNFRRGTFKSAQALRSYQRKILRRYPYLEIVRLDLTYQKSTSLSSIISAPPKDFEVYFGQIKAHRQALVKYLQKSSISKYVLGYAWKHSYALQRGANLHLLLLMKRSDKHAFGSIIGKRWTQNITKGQGVYFDCASLGAGYRAWGFVAYNVTEMNAQIENAALFMTLPDQLLKLTFPGHTFHTGQGERTKSTAKCRQNARPTIVQALQRLVPPLRLKKNSGRKA